MLLRYLKKIFYNSVAELRFIKHSDSTGMDDFLELKGTIIPKEELTEEQIPYYNYTCQPGDYIKTCSVPSPLFNEKDLEREKKMLEI